MTKTGPFIRPFPTPVPGFEGNLARVSPKLGPVTTLGFLGRRLTFYDGFLLVDVSQTHFFFTTAYCLM